MEKLTLVCDAVFQCISGSDGKIRNVVSHTSSPFQRYYKAGYFSLRLFQKYVECYGKASRAHASRTEVDDSIDDVIGEQKESLHGYSRRFEPPPSIAALPLKAEGDEPAPEPSLLTHSRLPGRASAIRREWPWPGKPGC